jgi:hypothetical protein
LPQNTFFYDLSKDPALWEPLARERWPDAHPDLHYGGDWRRFYIARAAMPTEVALAAARVRALTSAQPGRQAGVPARLPPMGIGQEPDESCIPLFFSFMNQIYIMSRCFNGKPVK